MPPQATPPILVSQTEQVCTITLNRPEALNSLNVAAHEALLAALNEAAQNASVRAVVLAAQGRAFCVGQDLSCPSVAPEPGQTKDLGAVIERHYAPLVRRLQSMPVPTVACVQGVAAGAGASLALNCDLVVAGQSAAFLQAFGKVGLLPDTGATSLLPRLIGRARSLGLMMLGDKLPAEEAQRMGLIWACVPDADLGATVATLANRLAAMPSRALAQTRAAVDAAPHMPLEALLAMEVRVQRELGASADYQEGVAAFAAKRAPVFKDR